MASNVITIQMTEEQINKIMNFYQPFKIELENDHIKAFYKIDDCAITIYNSLKIVFQGTTAEKEANMWREIENIPYENEWRYNVSHAGSDEVGTGDFFGPITVVATYVKKEDIHFISELGIKDSKKMSDEQILSIVPRILKYVTYSLLTLDNVLYNKLIKRGFNMNKIKAYLHNKALLNLEGKCNRHIPLFVIDQFTPEKNYYEYLKDEAKVIKRIEFVTKGESASPAVALSSILARYAFLKKMAQLREACGYNLPLGAGSKVDEMARKILDEKGLEFLQNITKSNFKNYEKIMKNSLFD